MGKVIQAVEPWVSTEMEKGKKWFTEIADHLEEANVGIICLTRENLNSPWLLFEAGALAKIKGAYVCTFLLDLKPTDVEPPLSEFQATMAEKDDIRKLLLTINKVLEKAGQKSLPEKTLDGTFSTFWPELDNILKEILKREEPKKKIRSTQDYLAEILDLGRKTHDLLSQIPSPAYIDASEREYVSAPTMSALDVKKSRKDKLKDSYIISGRGKRKLRK